MLAAVLLAGCTLPGAPLPAPLYPEEVLSAAPFTTLMIEVDHAPGRAPSAAALTHLHMTFQNITQKAELRLRVEQTLADSADKRWTADDLVALEKQTRSTEHAAPTAVLHVLYPAGRFERDGVAGVTIGGPILGPAVVFLDTLREYPVPLDAGPLGPAPPLPLPDESVSIIERSTLLHEAGHAIGLVNNGLEMVCPHEDAEHDGHSNNPDSIMYWAVDSLEGVRKMLLGDGQVPDKLDTNDLRDIQGGGGRGLPAPASC